MNNNNDAIIEFSGATRKFYDGKVRLGKKLNITSMNPQLKRHIAMRGMSHINLIAAWDTVIGSIYAEHSIPDSIKNISGIKTLICKVRYTRIIEFQHQKTEFIKQINLFAGMPLIADIRFVRVDNVPKKQKIPTPCGLRIPNELHPKLSKIESQCQNTELQKAFHLLAHVVMPIDKAVDNLVSLNKSENLLNSWRDRAKIILNCHDK
jgi:hypothetical protein